LDSTSSLSSLGILCSCIIAIAYIAGIFFVWTDANNRGKTGCLWALIVVAVGPIGIIAYLVLRDKDIRL
jgi:hypothetical protein